jgi:glutathione S-transferase
MTTPRFVLCYSPGTASTIVHWLLIELGVDHQLRLIDIEGGEHKQPGYLQLNPSGVVPTLLIDGEPVFEAAALMLQLADLHPEAGLAPAVGTKERARYYQWTLHLANSLQPAFRLWFYPAEGAGDANAEATKANARVRIEAAWDRLDAELARHGPYLLGEQISMLDFYATILMRWSRNMPKPATEWPHLRALAERMKARPSFKTLYEREGLADWT